MPSLSTRPSSVWPSVVWMVLRTAGGGVAGAWASAAPAAKRKQKERISVPILRGKISGLGWSRILGCPIYDLKCTCPTTKLRIDEPANSHLHNRRTSFYLAPAAAINL